MCHKRLIYITNGDTFTGKQSNYDIMTEGAGIMPPRCQWFQIFIYCVDGTAVQVTYEEAEKLLAQLKEKP
jgi:hypothetical protein